MKYKLSPKVAFALVSFFLGELGDGLNIFQVSLTNKSYHVSFFNLLMHHHPYSHTILIKCILTILIKCILYVSSTFVQGIYLVALGWNEGSVGIALSMMGFVSRGLSFVCFLFKY